MNLKQNADPLPQEVLATLQQFRHEAGSIDGGTCLMKTVPGRTAKDHITGSFSQLWILPPVNLPIGKMNDSHE